VRTTKVNRRGFLTAITIASPSLLQEARERVSENHKRLNIIFVLADDLGWGDLACYGHPSIKTPHLDWLAREGILFTQCYSASPVCSPSRAALMAGRFPAGLRIHGHLATPPEGRVEFNAERGMPNYLDPEIPCVTKLLKEAGYATGFFGKWHLGKAPDAPSPGAYGIDVHRTFDSNEMSWDLNSPRFQTHSTDLIVDETIKFIAQKGHRPFFVQVSLLDTHGRLSVTEEQTRPYTDLIGAPRIHYSAVTRVDQQVGRL